jgi:hypothetical protein
MARVVELLELLNTLILSSVGNTVRIDKTTLQLVVTCLHVSQAKATLLQTQTRLLHDALERKNRQHYELVLVQNNCLFKEDDDVDSDQQPEQQQLNETMPDSSTYGVQLFLSKWIIRPWEEIKNNRHKTGIGYGNDVNFHNLDYTKPIQFQSVALQQESSHSSAPVQEQIQKCQHC